MNSPILWAFCAALGTWLATAAGAATVLLLPGDRKRFPGALLGFAAGVMIAASFWSLLLPAAQMTAAGSVPSWWVLTIGFIAGAASMVLSDKAAGAVFPQRRSRSLLLLLSVTLHNIPEGMAVGVAFGSLRSGDSRELAAAISVAVGIGLQNFPEGAAVALPLRQEGTSRFRSFLAGQASALVEPVASLVGALLVIQVEALLPWALSFAAGAMILVAVHELIPQCQQCRGERPYHATAGIILGFSVMMLLDVMLG